METIELMNKVEALEKKIEMLEKRLPENTMSILVAKGNYDNVFIALVFAVTAANLGLKVNMFFTFWGINALKKKGSVSKKPFLKKVLGLLQSKEMDGMPLSALNIMGVGPLLLKHLMHKDKITDLPGMVDLALQAGVNLYACELTAKVMSLTAVDLIEGAKIYGVTSFLAEASRGKMLIQI